ncbi:MAG TPA: 3-ketoacyl-ACP reductase [bacterium]|nr:3-ketoacyl-ACP reductase [bacterium]HNT65725.1 3-ketoacyl-ACP reductase [bacterium]
MKNSRVALITGGARGIGFGIALKLAELGFDIAIDDVHPPEAVAENLAKLTEHGVQASYIQADISQAEGRRQLLEEIRARFGRLDVLMNNAGVSLKVRLDILETTEESYDRVLDINLRGPFFLTQAVANWMIEQKTAHPERDFKIINTASISSYTSSPSRGEYCLSKAGISMMTQLFADRLAEYGIYVYEVRPGIIETDMTSVVKQKYDKMIDEGLLPIKRWGYPEDIAKAAAAIVLGYLDYTTGQVINVDGGFHLRRL